MTPVVRLTAMRYVLIMAGGSGKRLWPLSRQDMPKQLLKVLGGRSLLRIAYDRLEGIVPPERVLVCTGADYADVVAQELPEVPVANILGEPEGRDSLNAVAWPAAVLSRAGPRRRGRGGHRRSDHAPRFGLPFSAGGGLRGGRGGPDRAGHVRCGADLAAHRVRLSRSVATSCRDGRA